MNRHSKTLRLHAFNLLCTLFLSIFFLNTLSSQIRCGSDALHETNMQDPEYAEWFNEYHENAISSIGSGERSSDCENTIIIPVAVHFYWAEEVSNMQCLIDASVAQVAALNRDFSGMADLTKLEQLVMYCPADYSLNALAGNTCIKFCLSKFDHPEAFEVEEGEYAITVNKFSSTWSTQVALSGYLNIWVQPTTPGNALGLAPVGGGARPFGGDGLVIRADVFGGDGISCDFGGVGINTLDNFNLGRTVTHEAGHYLGLFHIFDGCNNGDDIPDTPDQNQPNGGCPFEVVRSPCTPDAINSCDELDFFYNYMDYVYDACMIMFTENQADVMYSTSNHNHWNDANVKCCPCDLYDAPELSMNYMSDCPSTSFDLSELFVGDVPTGTEILWSTDGDPSDGVEPVIDPIVTQNGTYYVYFYNEEYDCYSERSSIEVRIESCCDITADIIITDNVVYNSPVATGGNIIIKSGGELTITSKLEMGEHTSIVVEGNGRLNLNGGASINKCPQAIRWEGILLQDNSRLYVNNAEIHSAYQAIHALDGSFLNLVGLKIEGHENLNENNTALFIETPFLREARSLVILNYVFGVKIYGNNNDGSYYFLRNSEILNCSNGVILNRAPTFIDNVKIYANDNGILNYYSSGSLLTNNLIYSNIGMTLFKSHGCVIENNVFGDPWSPASQAIKLNQCFGGTIRNDNIVHSDGRGIHMFLSDYSILHNTINVIASSAIPVQYRTGISLSVCDNVQVLDNKITGSNIVAGILSRSCNETRIEHNNLDLSNLTGGNRIAAIKSEGSLAEYIEDNEVQTSEDIHGILAHNTLGNKFICNKIIAGTNGEALAVFYNSEGQLVRANDFNGDLDLTIRSVIGDQVHEGNCYQGGDVWAENLDVASQSQFFVNSDYECHMPSNPNPSNGWFIDETHIHNYEECSGTPGPRPMWDDEEALCTWYQGIVNVYGQSSPEYARMVLGMIRLDAAVDNYSLPTCFTNDPSVSEVVNEEFTIRAVFGQEGLSSIANLHDIISELNDITLESELEDKLESLREVIPSFLLAIDGELDEYASKISDAAINLDKITTNDPILNLNIEVLKDLIDYVKEPERDIADFSEINEIGEYCSDEKGSYIHIARAIANQSSTVYFDDFDVCSEEGDQLRKANEKLSETLIFPNPTTSGFYIDFGQTVQAEYEIISPTGKIVAVGKIEGVSSNYLNLGLQTGVYLVRLLHENGTQEILRVAIIQ